MQANAEAQRAAVARGTLAHIGQLGGDRCRWFAPGEIDVDLLGCQFVGGLGRAAEVQRRIGFLHRWIQSPGATGLDEVAIETETVGAALAGQRRAPDAQEFIRDPVALGMVGEQAVGFQFAGVAAGDDIDQEAPLGQSIEGCRHARGQSG